MLYTSRLVVECRAPRGAGERGAAPAAALQPRGSVCRAQFAHRERVARAREDDGLLIEGSLSVSIIVCDLCSYTRGSTRRGGSGKGRCGLVPTAEGFSCRGDGGDVSSLLCSTRTLMVFLCDLFCGAIHSSLQQ
ncbi:unnamed protein product [Lampetra planeri]